MKSVSAARLAVCILAPVAFALLGCGRIQAEQDAADAATVYIRANQQAAKARLANQADYARDSEAEEALLTSKAQAQQHSDTKFTIELSPDAKYTLLNSLLKGDVDEVAARSETPGKLSSEMKLSLRREGGKWRIFAITLPAVPQGPPLVTFDLEDPEGKTHRGSKEK